MSDGSCREEPRRLPYAAHRHRLTGTLRTPPGGGPELGLAGTRALAGFSQIQPERSYRRGMILAEALAACGGRWNHTQKPEEMQAALKRLVLSTPGRKAATEAILGSE